MADGKGLGEALGEGGMMFVEEGVEPVPHEGGEGVAAGVAAGADEFAELAMACVAMFGFGVEVFLEAEGDGGVKVVGGFFTDFIGDDPGHEGSVGGDPGPVGKRVFNRRQRR